MNIENMQQSND